MSLKGIAKETLALLDAGTYITPAGKTIDFAAQQQQAVAETRLYTPDQAQALLHKSWPKITNEPNIEVTAETTQVAAARLVLQEGLTDVAVLNFASARNPGGGFINGAKAQEEDLARCSGLYPCLLTQPAYYRVNSYLSSLFYTDHIIFSQDVPWFRIDSTDPPNELFTASIITAPAPNAGQIIRREQNAWPAIETCLRHRAGLVLAVAREHHCENLILGAWGCGVFRNQPTMVADAFGQWLESATFKGAFQRVVFAIYDKTKDQSNLESFRYRFEYDGDY